MKHAFLGAGGIGGFLGGALARAGMPVTFILRPEALENHPSTVTVTSRVLGDFEAPVKLAAELDEPVGVLWVTVKATQLDGAMDLVPSSSVGNALIVPLLNGVEHVAKLRARYAPDQVIPGTIRVESERVAPGVIRQLSPFAAVRLAAVGTSALRVRELAAEVRAVGLEAEVVDDEMSLLWAKLAFLAPLALTTTAKDGPLGDVRSDPAWRARMEACAAEACAAGQAAGARVDPRAVLDLLTSGPGTMRSSMQKDVEAGRPPELDAIGGPIVRVGQAHGLDVSTTQELMDIIASRISRSV